jgi:hypothetical protein
VEREAVEVVDIRLVLYAGDLVGLRLEASDLLTVVCKRTELADDIGLTLALTPVPDREESVDQEMTLARDARVINTFFTG